MDAPKRKAITVTMGTQLTRCHYRVECCWSDQENNVDLDERKLYFNSLIHFVFILFGSHPMTTETSSKFGRLPNTTILLIAKCNCTEVKTRDTTIMLIVARQLNL